MRRHTPIMSGRLTVFGLKTPKVIRYGETMYSYVRTAEKSGPCGHWEATITWTVVFVHDVMNGR